MSRIVSNYRLVFSYNLWLYFLLSVFKIGIQCFCVLIAEYLSSIQTYYKIPTLHVQQFTKMFGSLSIPITCYPFFVLCLNASLIFLPSNY
jgi:hypothetical protein